MTIGNTDDYSNSGLKAAAAADGGGAAASRVLLMWWHWWRFDCSNVKAMWILLVEISRDFACHPILRSSDTTPNIYSDSQQRAGNSQQLPTFIPHAAGSAFGVTSCQERQEEQRSLK
jgi:hypothetical protein